MLYVCSQTQHWHSTISCIPVIHSSVIHSSVIHSAVIHSSVLHSSVIYSSVHSSGKLVIIEWWVWGLSEACRQGFFPGIPVSSPPSSVSCFSQ